MALIIMRLLLSGKHLVNGGQLIGGEVKAVEGLNVVDQLTRPAGTYQDASHC